MFRFAYEKVNTNCTAAAACAEAVSFCSAEMLNRILMDAALLASIIICAGLISQRLLALVVVVGAALICSAVSGMKTQRACIE